MAKFSTQDTMQTTQTDKPHTNTVVIRHFTKSMTVINIHYISLWADGTCSSYLILLVDEALFASPLLLLKSFIFISKINGSRYGDVTE